MDRETVIAQLITHEAELRDLGVSGLALFGSTARGEAGPCSDVDLAARLDEGRRLDLFDFAVIGDRLQAMLGVPVDLVTEPARKARFQAEIDRDRVHVF